jgi:two-component system response regulator AtoC
MSAANKPSCDQVIDMLTDPFVIIDLDYNIIAANQAYKDRYGVSAADLHGRRCHEISHQSTVPCGQHGEHCPLEDVRASGRSTQVMHVHYDADGQQEYVQISAAPLFDEAGQVAYMGEQVVTVNQRVQEESLLVGRSRPMLQVISLLHRVAPTGTMVLLLGESGVGKECFAEYLHRYSKRLGGPLVVVDCATLGEQLIESELFGHEKGAFTGAAGRKIGLFEAAHGGTLFIDEIGELPLALQTKLLRALETGMIRRLGGTDYRKVDVRVIAATNCDMRRMVDDGAFRKDLYYRLSAFPIRIPPLRERKDDIPALAEHFLALSEDGERHVPLSPEVIETLLAYDYPGNVRELRNIIERAAILACDDVLQPEHLVFEDGPSLEPVRSCAPPRLWDRRRGRLDPGAVLGALNACNGHRAEAARKLGVSERTLYRYLQRLRPGDDAGG